MHSLLHFTAALALLPATISAITLDCEHIVVDKQSFKFGKLGGPKSVHFQDFRPPNVHNTTFTFDVCNPLKIDPEISKDQQCPHGTRLCAIDKEWRGGEELAVSAVIPIAGEYTTRTGKGLDPKYTRLNGSESHADAGLEGLRMEIKGGMYGKIKQKAIIEFVCDSEVEGTEGFEDEAALMVRRSMKDSAMRTSEDDDEDDGGDGEDESPSFPDLDEGKALQFNSYKTERDDWQVLRLTWKTKYACESQAGDDDGNSGDESKSSHWGFFTWFIIIVFLLAAAYIIFGSWLNYNRYGARGWDLIPHGDTIRDLPYIARDWIGSLSDKLRGGGSRGGYSAV